MTTQKSDNGRRIKNEEQYEKSLAWLVEKANELENDPLLQGEASAEIRAELMRKYDFVSEQVLEYRRREREGDAK